MKKLVSFVLSLGSEFINFFWVTLCLQFLITVLLTK